VRPETGPLETAVTKRLTDDGIRVLRESDEDTYLYVNVGTVTTSAGLLRDALRRDVSH
jgi:hypothetical protein